MNTGSNHREALNLRRILTTAILTLLIGGCGPSEKQLKDEADRMANDEKNAKIEKLQSIVRDGLRDPASTQFRNIKLLSGNNVLCGEVNSKNAYGGYGGFTPFAVNSAGQVIHLEAIPIVEVIALTKKTKEERKKYIQEYAVDFARLGAIKKGVQVSLELDKMEKFSMDNFSLWSDCFTE